MRTLVEIQARARSNGWLLLAAAIVVMLALAQLLRSLPLFQAEPLNPSLNEATPAPAMTVAPTVSGAPAFTSVPGAQTGAPASTLAPERPASTAAPAPQTAAPAMVGPNDVTPAPRSTGQPNQIAPNDGETPSIVPKVSSPPKG
jgi:hypothetical protein